MSMNIFKKVWLYIWLVVFLFSNGYSAMAYFPPNIDDVLIAESADQGYAGMYAVACCFKNRLIAGMDLGSCAIKRPDLEEFIAKQPAYVKDRAEEIILLVFGNKNNPDPTHGAIYFDNFEAFGVPDFAQDEYGNFDTSRYIITTKIKDHTFFKELEAH